MDITGGVDTLENAASILLKESVSDHFGRVSTSIHETARLVSAAPWLTGHRTRVETLVRRQHPDGSWGGEGAYRIVPTLSATEALLGTDHADAHAAANRGLRVVRGWFTGEALALPDTVAVELLVPALLSDINARLDTPLPLPRNLDIEKVEQLRQRARSGKRLPEKLWHSLEAVGPAVKGVSWIRPAQGAVACSPASTAVWLGENPPTESVHYLTNVQQSDGTVPTAAPVDVFERAWIVSQLVSAGFPVSETALLDSLSAALGPDGAAVGAGMPPDVDDTAVALHALALAGRPQRVDSLEAYRTGDRYVTFPNERTTSTTANAHVLQALGGSRELARWLRECQRADGSWADKWHASPYYATACCVNALAEPEPIAKAAAWVRETQRPDGSWGVFEGTYEETAYAIQILTRADSVHGVHGVQFGHPIGRGARFLLAWGERPHPPLWHDKDLYTPERVVRAAGLAALRLATSGPRILAERP